MLLPQSAAFAALRNRLNTVSAKGYLHIAPRTYVPPFPFHLRQKSTEAQLGSTPPTPAAAFDRPNRLKAREDGAIKWGELLEKFKSVQEKARRAHRLHNEMEDGTPAMHAAIESSKEKALPDVPKQSFRPLSAAGSAQRPVPPAGTLHNPKSSLVNLWRLASGVGSRKGKKL